jgi:hypothetical protein
MLRVAMAGLLLSGLYSDGAKRALAEDISGGTVICAGKTYRDVTYATIEPVGYTEVVRLWVGTVTDATVHQHRSAAKFTIVLNTDIMCEMVDVDLHVRGEDD